MSTDCWYCAPDPFDAYVISDCEACNERAAFRKRIEELEADLHVWRTRAYELMATKQAVYEAVTSTDIAWEVTP